MAGYISYCTFTQEGLKNLKKAPDVIKQAKANLEKMGVKTVGVWSTFGEYDLVAVFDAPDDYAAAVVALNSSARGLWTTKTIRALSEDEFAQVVQRLP
jgi:uncharacterized protein with GYD domain